MTGGYFMYLGWLVFARLRCAGLFHHFETVDTGDYSGYAYGTLWYCTRCYIYERTDEIVTSTPFQRFVWFFGGSRTWHRWLEWRDK